MHELVHHFSGYIICGDWGYKTFNYFETSCEGSPQSWYATYMGPVFSFVMMYIGAYFINKGLSTFKKHLGFAMIFAQLPLQRMISPFFRMNDEFYATAQLFGNTTLNYWIVIVIIWIICIPPLITAYKAIKNNRKLPWFLFYLVLFPYILWGPVFGLLEFLMVQKGIMSHTFIGIGLLFIINELVTIAAYFIFKKYINPER